VTNRALSGQAALAFGLCMLMLGLTGCQAAVRGVWTLERATPNKEAFCIERAAFRADNTYDAVVTINGGTARQSGTYAFTGSQLKLRPSEGGQHTFQAELQLDELRIKRGKNLVVLKKRKGG
jgi:hypothetical protein